MTWKRLVVAATIIPFIVACNLITTEEPKQLPPVVNVLPAPKQVHWQNQQLCFSGTLYFYSGNSELDTLYHVLKNEILTMTGMPLEKTTDPNAPGIQLFIDRNLQEEEYRVEIVDRVKIYGADYRAVAMGTATALQSLQMSENNICWNGAVINDQPDLHFRSLLVDVARNKHDLGTLKNIVNLCRWYKINHLQLHLTDDEAFTFPSVAFPQLTSESGFTAAQLTELVNYAQLRGIQLIPELDVPGHSARLIEKMPWLFGFNNRQLNHNTVNIGKDATYVALDTLIGEVAHIFRYSDYIHIGGDEANFKGMEQDREVAAYLKQNDLQNVEELYWHFINRMHSFVKKRGKKTMVWEGFSKEGNPVIDKDITVMAWETKYQLPQDLLEGGFKIINASWKPLYVVNEKKWSPQQIYNWNVYSWQNWVPEMPSYTPIRLSPDVNVLGSAMASWEQPSYVQLSSLRKRLPAMADRIWNVKTKMTDSVFLATLQLTDSLFDQYMSPVTIAAKGLLHPTIQDGRNKEQTWFGDTLRIALQAPKKYTIRYTLNNAPVDSTSMVYERPLVFNNSQLIKFRAFRGNTPVGNEELHYYELHPLEVSMQGGLAIAADKQWESRNPTSVSFIDSMKLNISANRSGTIRYVTGNHDLSIDAPLYHQPITIKDTVMIKAGLFVNNTLIGAPWVQYFKKESH